MSFKKYNPLLKEILTYLKIDAPTPFQKELLPKIKSGANLFAFTKDGNGKTISLIISVLNKLNCEAEGDVPRAVIVVNDKKAALELEETFLKFTENTTLRVFAAIEQHHLNNQKDELYNGYDIVIATPKRLSKLFYLNGINLNGLKLFAIDDAQNVFNAHPNADILRISTSFPKCQYLVYAEKMTNKIRRTEEHFMENAQIIEA